MDSNLIKQINITCEEQGDQLTQTDAEGCAAILQRLIHRRDIARPRIPSEASVVFLLVENGRWLLKITSRDKQRTADENERENKKPPGASVKQRMAREGQSAFNTKITGVKSGGFVGK